VDRDSLKSIILEVVTSINGGKGVDIATRVAVEAANQNNGSYLLDEYHSVLEELINGGELVEVEYTTPANQGRLKSFILPKGSEVVSVRNYHDETND